MYTIFLVRWVVFSQVRLRAFLVVQLKDVVLVTCLPSLVPLEECKKKPSACIRERDHLHAHMEEATCMHTHDFSSSTGIIQQQCYTDGRLECVEYRLCHLRVNVGGSVQLRTQQLPPGKLSVFVRGCGCGYGWSVGVCVCVSLSLCGKPAGVHLIHKGICYTLS